MAKQFIKGNVYVFVKKKCAKSINSNSGITKLWMDELNGREVCINHSQLGHIGSTGYMIDPEWCKCISNKALPLAKPLSFDEIRELDEMLCEHCSCTEYGLEMGSQHISAYSYGCEGTWCEEAYENYLEDFEED